MKNFDYTSTKGGMCVARVLGKMKYAHTYHDMHHTWRGWGLPFRWLGDCCLMEKILVTKDKRKRIFHYVSCQRKTPLKRFILYFFAKRERKKATISLGYCTSVPY